MRGVLKTEPLAVCRCGHGISSTRRCRRSSVWVRKSLQRGTSHPCRDSQAPCCNAQAFSSSCLQPRRSCVLDPSPFACRVSHRDTRALNPKRNGAPRDCSAGSRNRVAKHRDLGEGQGLGGHHRRSKERGHQVLQKWKEASSPLLQSRKVVQRQIRMHSMSTTSLGTLRETFLGSI